MRELNKYIDRCIIDEYAHKDREGSLELDISDIPPNELSNFLSRLMDEDTTVRDFVRDQMQKLIDERIPEVEWQHKEFSSPWKQSA